MDSCVDYDCSAMYNQRTNIQRKRDRLHNKSAGDAILIVLATTGVACKIHHVLVNITAEDSHSILFIKYCDRISNWWNISSCVASEDYDDANGIY